MLAPGRADPARSTRCPPPPHSRSPPVSDTRPRDTASDADVVTSREKKRAGDVIFAGISRGAGFTILVALAGVGIFLTVQGIPAFGAEDYKGAGNLFSYTWPLVYGTVLAAAIALLLATPLSIAVALISSHYAPRRLAVPIGYIIDLLAAVPSVVYGLWGIGFLGPQLVPIYQWLNENAGFLPFFANPADPGGRTILTVGIVLAIMILPIISAIMRDIFAQTPTLHQEAALALGATRWEMIRMTVFPYAKSGMVSATMLGLGRALGETMAVAMILSATGTVTINLIGSANPDTIAANIALDFPESSGVAVNVLIFSGLVLFALTFVVNFAARAIVERSGRSS
ncbi:phosphate ABC transporter permease subunit PstC [Nocardioidaceae bacterium]|nr:phosphate ABC transporter permease subunit PstC [Nocardioidaceae bacterium]